MCPCGGIWFTAVERILRNCNVCELSIGGIPVGMSAPLYGSLARFGPDLYLTALSTSAAQGSALPFTSTVPALTFNASSAPSWCK